jgi:flagellar hook-length control protein FliK
MNIGQIVPQIPFGTGLETLLPVLGEPMTAENRAQTSPFADLLRDISPLGTSVVRTVLGGTKFQQMAGHVAAESTEKPDQQIVTPSLPTDVKLVLRVAAAGNSVDVPESIVSEKMPADTENKEPFEVKNSQNVPVNAPGIQLVPLLQLEGRKPEPQVVDQADVSISASHAAEAATNTFSQRIPDRSPQHEAIASPAPAASSHQPETIMVAPDETTSVAALRTPETTSSPNRAEIVAPAAPAPSSESGNIRPAVTSASPSPEPEVSTVAAPVTPANLTAPVLDTYYQSSPRPSTVPAPVLQTIAAADTPSPAAPAPTATAPLSAATSESTPSATLAALPSRPLPVSPVAAESPEPAIPAPVAQPVASASSPRVTVTPTHVLEKVVQDVSPLRQGASSNNRIPEQSLSVTPGSVKEPATLDSGGNSTGNGNEDSEPNLNRQAHLMVVPQHKTEPSVPITVPTTQDLRESLTKEAMEHVVQQVKEHLTSRDYKTGTEQISIRLTPDNMGELKMNLRMENRQLKVEIITENSMIRDTLLKHSDSLRETLAKQNISMESFDVSTSGNGSSSGRNQSDWRELAKQRQNNAVWLPNDGYRMADMPSKPVLKYQAQTNHSMVDVHF